MKNSVLDKIRSIQRRVLDGIVKGNPRLGLDRRAESFVRIFESHLKPKSLVLDIGGGWGFYARPLEKRGHTPVILDVVCPGLQHAPVFIYGPGQRMPFPDKSFDASLLVTVLHHTPDPERILREAIRVTRGQVIVIEDLYHHAFGKLWTQLRDQIYNFEFFGHPGNFRKREEWLRTFESLGLTVAGERQVYTWLSGMRILNGVFILQVPKEETMSNPIAVEKVLWVKKGAGVSAAGCIPADAEFFQDHFPGFPVLPGVLALEMLKQSADCYLRSVTDDPTAHFSFQKVSNVKFSDYLRPGDPWESELALVSNRDEQYVWKAVLTSKGKTAVSARLALEAKLAVRMAVQF